MLKKNKARIFTILFFIVVLLDLIAIAFHYPVLEAVVKPMLMILLMGVYAFSSEKRNNWYLLALAFSFLGDVLLMDKENMFLFGIASFLMTQLIYIKLILKRTGKSELKQKIIAIIPFLIYIIVLLSVLKENLGKYLIPVIVYGIAISVFGMVSLHFYLQKRNKVSVLMLTGAVLFILSDSMIALNKFYESHELYPVAIMLTYTLAQYLILRSVVGSENRLSRKTKV